MPRTAHRRISPAAASAILLAAGTSIAAAQACPPGEVFEHPGLRSIPGIDELFPADVNGDGAPDLLTYSHTAIAVHINDGAGNFAPAVVSPLNESYSEGNAFAISIDVEGDGDPDLVVSERGRRGLPPVVEIYTNDGAGNFAFDHAVPLDPGAETFEIFEYTVSGDYNADGLTDLLVRQGEPNATSIYINDNGTFGGERWTVPLTDSTDPASVRRALDINRDGTLDLLMILPDGSYTTTLGSASGFSAPLASPSLTMPTFARPSADDFDGDGVTDLFGRIDDPAIDAEVGIYFGNADGTFGEPVQIPGGYPYFSRVIADPTSSEGQPSWIIESSFNASSRVTVDPDRTITVVPLLDTEGNPLPEVDAVVDIDHDGDGDMIADARVFTLRPDGAFEPNTTPYLSGSWGDFVSVDLNGDAVADNASPFGRTPDGDTLIQLALSDGAGGYDFPRGLDTRPLWTDFGSLTDLNADAVPDALGRTIAGDEWAIITAIGSPDAQYTAFTETPTGITSNAAFIAVTAGDHDGDGLTDLVAAAPNGFDVLVFHGGASGNFGPAVEFNVVSGLIGFQPDRPRIAAADFDNDGALDLLLSIAGGANRGYVLWQDPATREYTAFTRYNGPRPSKPDIADLNGDGDPDFMYGNEVNQQGSSAVQFNNGDRTFTAFTLGDHNHLAAVGDLNGDGVGDVAGTRPFAIYLSEGVTNGMPTQFVAAPISLGANDPGAIADLDNAGDAAGIDIDADGDRDLLVAANGGAIVRNLGNGAFALDGVYEDHIPDSAVSVASFDADADGMPDAVLCYAQAVLTRRNQCSPPAPCPADLAPPAGVLDLADISAFVGAFAASDPAADLQPDGVYDLADIAAFLASFNAGCP